MNFEEIIVILEYMRDYLNNCYSPNPEPFNKFEQLYVDIGDFNTKHYIHELGYPIIEKESFKFIPKAKVPTTYVFTYDKIKDLAIIRENKRLNIGK